MSLKSIFKNNQGMGIVQSLIFGTIIAGMAVYLMSAQEKSKKSFAAAKLRTVAFLEQENLKNLMLGFDNEELTRIALDYLPSTPVSPPAVLGFKQSTIITKDNLLNFAKKTNIGGYQVADDFGIIDVLVRVAFLDMENKPFDYSFQVDGNWGEYKSQISVKVIYRDKEGEEPREEIFSYYLPISECMGGVCNCYDQDKPLPEGHPRHASDPGKTPKELIIDGETIEVVTDNTNENYKMILCKFHLEDGETVEIKKNVGLVIRAHEIFIEGEINGSGRGYPGGVGGAGLDGNCPADQNPPDTLRLLGLDPLASACSQDFTSSTDAEYCPQTGIAISKGSGGKGGRGGLYNCTSCATLPCTQTGGDGGGGGGNGGGALALIAKDKITIGSKAHIILEGGFNSGNGQSAVVGTPTGATGGNDPTVFYNYPTAEVTPRVVSPFNGIMNQASFAGVGNPKPADSGGCGSGGGLLLAARYVKFIAGSEISLDGTIFYGDTSSSRPGHPDPRSNPYPCDGHLKVIAEKTEPFIPGTTTSVLRTNPSFDYKINIDSPYENSDPSGKGYEYLPLSDIIK